MRALPEVIAEARAMRERILALGWHVSDPKDTGRYCACVLTLRRRERGFLLTVSKEPHDRPWYRLQRAAVGLDARQRAPRREEATFPSFSQLLDHLKRMSR